MRGQRRNLELKASAPDLSASFEVCRALGAEDRGEIAQRDTYFAVAHGGLKLREEQPGRPHLIQFERTSEPQQRESRYGLIELEAVAPPDSDLAHEHRLIAELREALGITDERLVTLGYAEQLLGANSDPDAS